MKDIESRLQELEDDSEFIDQLKGAKSLEDAAQVFNSYGVQLTADELKGIIPIDSDLHRNDELCEKELGKINGGTGKITVSILLRMLKRCMLIA